MKERKKQGKKERKKERKNEREIEDKEYSHVLFVILNSKWLTLPSDVIEERSQVSNSVRHFLDLQNKILLSAYY